MQPRAVVDKVIDGRYKITQPIGQGGMGAVYLANEIAIERPVAIKFIDPQHSLPSDVIDKAKREPQFLAKLEPHQHVMVVYDQGKTVIDDQEYLYLVMPYAKGGALSDKLPLATEEVERILQQICIALDHIHEKDLIHLDIKPQNILFDENDEVLVSDFGIARLLEGASRVQLTRALGTLDYAAPEQRDGELVGPAADIYALGVVLHEMLTGKVPKNHHGECILDSSLHPRVQAVIKRAIHQDPRRRYRTAGDLAKAFSQAVHGKPSFILPWWLAGFILVGTIIAFALLFNIWSDSSIWPFEPTAMNTPTYTMIPTPVTPTLTLTAAPTSTPTETSTPTLAPSPSPLPSATFSPLVRVSSEAAMTRFGPGDEYESFEMVYRGDELPLLGCTRDRAWLQVDCLGWIVWIPASNAEPGIDCSAVPIVSPPPTPVLIKTSTPQPTGTATPWPGLRNPGFEGIVADEIPEWEVLPEYDENTDIRNPVIKQADDPARFISGSTLQIEALRYRKFRIYLYQIVGAKANQRVSFRISARAYTSEGWLNVRVGINPDGGVNCKQALWGEFSEIDPNDGVVSVSSPWVLVGPEERITVCIYAEPAYPVVSNAVFFDNASLSFSQD